VHLWQLIQYLHVEIAPGQQLRQNCLPHTTIHNRNKYIMDMDAYIIIIIIMFRLMMKNNHDSHGDDTDNDSH